MSTKTTTRATGKAESLGGADADTNELFFGTRHRYMSKAWREAYGATLSHAEIKLIQGFRGLDRDTQELLCEITKELVVAGSRRSAIVALRRGLRTLGKDNLIYDADNLRAWAHEADVAVRRGLPVQIPGGVR